MLAAAPTLFDFPGFQCLAYRINRKTGEIDDRRAMSYVAYLLLHPPEQPIHAVDLMARVPAVRRGQTGLVALADPSTGAAVPLDSNARLQERSLAMDDAQSLQALRKRIHELHQTIEDDREAEPVKEEARRELEEIVSYQKRQRWTTRDNASRAVHAVRTAIRRFYDELSVAIDSKGQPHLALREFAQHIRDYILVPSGRYAAKHPRQTRASLAGRLTYEPPEGVVWVEE